MKSNMDVKAVLATLPPMAEPMTEAELAEALRVCNNTSVRLTPKQAALLIVLERTLRVPRAAAIKACLDFALPHLFAEANDSLKAWAAAQPRTSDEPVPLPGAASQEKSRSGRK